ncbi:MAG: hypothetical protein KTR24_16470 [Saprospiraceae bacterium]|nr:hypothetical protein [Saprospiraceae bacterium]
MLKRNLKNASPFVLFVTAGLASFLLYFAMYGLRKPFTVAAFSEMTILGLEYKITLIISQVFGYALAKWLGIKVISEHHVSSRTSLIIGLTTSAQVALVCFAIFPAEFGPIALFINGLSLGMIWGLVFAYLEGRQGTEIMAAILCLSFILAGGATRSFGKFLLVRCGVAENWMPATAGCLFLPLIILMAYFLQNIPPPTDADVALRSKRKAMSKKERRIFLKKYAPGIAMLILTYGLLTIIRDLRDNFSAEIWSELHMEEHISIYFLSETPIAIGVLLLIGSTYRLASNIKALRLYFLLMAAGALMMLGSTTLFQAGYMTGTWWMILLGLGLYLGYVPLNGFFYERLFALFKETGTIGFLIYLADAFGYLVSSVILLLKNLFSLSMEWILFVGNVGKYGSSIILTLVLLTALYFEKILSKSKKTVKNEQWH